MPRLHPPGRESPPLRPALGPCGTSSVSPAQSPAGQGARAAAVPSDASPAWRGLCGGADVGLREGARHWGVAFQDIVYNRPYTFVIRKTNKGGNTHSPHWYLHPNSDKHSLKWGIPLVNVTY